MQLPLRMDCLPRDRSASGPVTRELVALDGGEAEHVRSALAILVDGADLHGDRSFIAVHLDSGGVGAARRVRLVVVVQIPAEPNRLNVRGSYGGERNLCEVLAQANLAFDHRGHGKRGGRLGVHGN